jgi:hypothetical protein
MNHSKGHLENLFYHLANLIQKTAEDSGIILFADYGTLLGAARTGRFIPWDGDIDFSVLQCGKDWELRWDRFLQRLEQQGCKVDVKRLDKLKGLSKEDSSVLVKRGSVAADIFVWKRITNNEEFLSYHSTLSEANLPREHFWGRLRYATTDFRDQKGLFLMDRWLTEWTTLPFGKAQVKAPVLWEELLEHRYPNWRTPVCQKPSTNALREFLIHHEGMNRSDALREVHKRLKTYEEIS